MKISNFILKKPCGLTKDDFMVFMVQYRRKGKDF